MIIQAEVSLYPLGTPLIGETIDAFIDQLSRPGVNIAKGNMSTVLDGEQSDVFASLNAAFTETINAHAAVLVVKMSNACPAHGATTPEHTPQHFTKKETDTNGS